MFRRKSAKEDPSSRQIWSASAEILCGAEGQTLLIESSEAHRRAGRFSELKLKCCRPTGEDGPEISTIHIPIQLQSFVPQNRLDRRECKCARRIFGGPRGLFFPKLRGKGLPVVLMESPQALPLGLYQHLRRGNSWNL